MGRRLQTSLCQAELRRTLRETGKDYVNVCHSMCIKNSLNLPFWHEAGILISQGTILWQAFSSQLSESQSS